MPRRRALAALLTLAALLALASVTPASAHDERKAHFPPGTGSVPTYRTAGPTLLVCGTDARDFAARIAAFPAALREQNRALFGQCQASGYRELQAAVDAVAEAGTRILVLPGLYTEPSSLAAPSAECASIKAPRSRFGYLILSYEQQRACPHLENLVGIFGARDLQVEGTGASPGDVVFDGEFHKLNVIRADRSDGVYFRNFTVEKATFNALYVLETDGFVIDQVIGRWDEEYGFLTFASDHGLYTSCEAYGNGDSGLYPGGTSDINHGRGYDVIRYAIEIRGCHSHDNLLGYSGTGGDSVYVHDNELDHNSAGASMDSAYPNHPGLPQNHALFENNLIHDNNSDYFRYVRDGTCAKPYATRGVENGVVCPAVGVPVGTGVIIAGGNYDVFRHNHVWNNLRYGFFQLWVPGFVRNDFSLPAQFETSHHDRYVDNVLGVSPDGRTAPNGVDFYWDGAGTGNCWQGGATSDPLRVPGCADAVGPVRLITSPATIVSGLVCTSYDRAAEYLPPLCGWFFTPGSPVAIDLNTTGFLLAGLQALLLIPLALLWGRRRRETRGDLAGVLGAALITVGAAGILDAPLETIGVALLAAWWLELGYRVRGRFGWFTVIVGAFALLEAADIAFDIPLLPLGPVWPRVLLMLVWIPIAALGLRRRPRAVPSTLDPAEKRVPVPSAP